MARLTGGEAVVEALEALGVRHVFGIVSVHNIPIYDAIARRASITPINMRHEQGAVHAADGYARATGRLGVAITSTGPGAANAMGGLFEAHFASSRVLMVTGQVESMYYGKGKGFLHEAERQLDMLRTVCRRAETVRRTEDVVAVIGQVATDVCTGRPRPGAVEIPVDLQHATAEPAAPSFDAPAQVPPDDKPLEEAAALLRSAARPLIWAGGGVVSGGAWEELAALAERLGAPVVTSTEGRGAIPEDHPLSLGPAPELPMIGAVIGDADVVLAVGTRFQMATTRTWAVAIPGRLIHLDADPSSIGRTYSPAVALVGDARLGLARLLELVPEGAADPAFAERARAARAEMEAWGRDQIGPDFAAIMDAIRAALPRDANVVKDATMAAYFWGNRLLPVLAPRTSIRPASMAIGPGLALAIGAALGTGRRTVLIQGDGGLMLSVGELASAVEARVPLVVLVFNDGGYGIIRWMQDQMFGGRHVGVDLVTPDFVALAQSVGMPAERVQGADKFAAAFERAAESDGPSLLDIDMASLRPMEVRPSRPYRAGAPGRSSGSRPRARSTRETHE